MGLAVLPLLHELCGGSYVIHLIKLEVCRLANAPASQRQRTHRDKNEEPYINACKRSARFGLRDHRPLRYRVNALTLCFCGAYSSCVL